MVLDFQFFVKQVRWSCLIEEFIDKLTLMADRPSLFSHDHHDMDLLELLFEIDNNDNFNKISQVNSIGVSNACDKALKKM